MSVVRHAAPDCGCVSRSMWPYPLSPRMITFSKTFFRDAILARGKTKASVSNASKQYLSAELPGGAVGQKTRAADKALCVGCKGRKKTCRHPLSPVASDALAHASSCKLSVHQPAFSVFNCARANVLFLLFLFPVSFRDCLQLHPRKRPAPPLSTVPLHPPVVLQHAYSVLLQISHVSLSIARSPLPSFPAARSLSLSLSLIIALRSPCTHSHRRNSRARTLNLLRILARSTAIHRPILALLFIARFASPCAFPPAPASPFPTLSLSPRAFVSRSLAPSSRSASPIVAHTPFASPLSIALSLIAHSRAR